MLKRVLYTAIIIVVAGSGLFAQSSKLKRAAKFMEDLNYVGAIELYNQVLENEDNSEAKINIAECYRKISDSENAEYWYGQVVRLPEAEPLHMLYYGQALQRNGKCDLAKEWYVKFVNLVPDDLRGQYLERACDYEEELMTKNAGVYEITHLDFNSNLDDFSPAYFGDGLVFASERDKGSAIDRTHCWTGNPFLELYYVDAKESGGDENGACGDFMYGRPEKYVKTLNTKYHDAAVTYNADQSEIFYTRNNLTGKDDEGTIKLKVFSAKKSGENSWGSLEGMPFNSDEYSVAHPTLTPDGNTLYFSSDMPGGFGGMDLYKSERESGRWGPPINLGPQINTEAHEVFPYYEQDGRLYFSSDGHVGLGGLDIYYMDDNGNGDFGTINNIGYPLNTISDDFGLIFNEAGTCGYFSSDRSGGAGRDDIYSFKKIAVPVEVFVYDEKTGDPIEGASVVDDCTGSTLTTNEEGKATIDMKLNECCTFTASAETYQDNDEEGCTTADLSSKTFVEIPLRRAIVFDLEGIVFADGNPTEGATVTLTNDCDDSVETVISDEEGRFYFELEEGCCYTVKGELETYDSATSSGQCTKDLTESTTLQTNLNLSKPGLVTQVPTYTDPGPSTPSTYTPPTSIYYDSGQGKYIDPNTGLPAEGEHGGLSYRGGDLVGGSSGGFEPSYSQPTDGTIAYLLHIYYDFDQSYLRDEAMPDLNKLLDLLNANPDYIVEIGSHTDSRGSDSYNNRLSQRRAESVVRWLTEQGVDRERLVARGYGETVNVNNCANEVPCSEKEHQFNRRTEFRVLGCRGCIDNAKISQPKVDPRLDPCQSCPF